MSGGAPEIAELIGYAALLRIVTGLIVCLSSMTGLLGLVCATNHFRLLLRGELSFDVNRDLISSISCSRAKLENRRIICHRSYILAVLEIGNLLLHLSIGVAINLKRGLHLSLWLLGGKLD